MLLFSFYSFPLFRSYFTHISECETEHISDSTHYKILSAPVQTAYMWDLRVPHPVFSIELSEEASLLSQSQIHNVHNLQCLICKHH